MSFELFKRRWSVQVDTLKVDGLRVRFDVQKALTKEPNTAEVTISNLGAESRKAIESSKGKLLTVTAGYEKTEAVVFQGDVRFASSSREGPDWLTKIESGDGETAYAHSPVSLSFTKNTSAADVVKGVVKALGVGEGNLSSVLSTLAQTSHPRGFSAHGQASNILDNLLRRQGLAYSIQNGHLQVLSPDQPIDAFAVLLTASSGLIGAPEFETPKEKNKPTVIKLKSYLQPSIRCGGLVTAEVGGKLSQYIATKVQHQGDSHGAGWYTLVEATAK